MKKRIYSLIVSNILVKGSLIILAGSTITNIGSYLFHLSMGRLLGPADYGVLESLISILYFLGIPVGVLTLVIVKFVSANSSHNKRISLFVKEILIKAAGYGALFCLCFLFFYPLLKNVVKINSFIIFFCLAISFYLNLFNSIGVSVLQGMLKFIKVCYLSIITSWLKFIFAVILVILGLKIFGAVYGIVISSVFSLLIVYLFVRKWINFRISGRMIIGRYFKKIGSYSLAILFSNLSMTSLYTIDIILAGYYLPSVEAGEYAALSVLGKIIFFASSPVISVMFPVISERKSRGEDYQKLLFLSLSIVAFLSCSVSLVYYLSPKLMIQILYGSKYLGASGNLFPFSIFISLYSVCNLLVNYFLSVSQTKAVIIPVSLAVFQVVLISFLHTNIKEIIRVNIFVVILLMVGLILFYFMDEKVAKDSVGNRSRI